MKLTSLSIYPIKSCGGIELMRATTEVRGFPDDRRWMLIDREGRFLTQREHPRMALIRLETHDDALSVNAPGMAPLTVPRRITAGTRLQTVIWDDTVSALYAGREADAWFTSFLKLDCRLVTMDAEARRNVDRKYARGGEEVSFADAFPYLLISEGSLNDLNRRLQQPVPMNRFRPNLVIGGCEAFAEDRWKRLQVGSAVFRVAKPCARCIIPTTNQQTAERSDEPLRTLTSFRNVGNKVLFGQNLLLEQAGIVNIGDELRILA